MKNRIAKLWLSLAAAAALLLAMAVPAAALNDIYRFDELGMSVKVSKNYYVVTRDTPADDPVFDALQLDYQDTMNEYQNAQIYLRAYDPDGLFQLSLTVTGNDSSKAIGNYADLSDAERRGILDTLQASVPSATQVRRGSFVFFDSSRESSIDGEPLYINQCNTVVNGLQIDFTLSKSGEPIAASEAKVLVALASSMEFDTVQTKTSNASAASTSSGLAFDWWRLMLWALILIAITLALSLAARHRNAVRSRRMEERRLKREEAAAVSDTAETVTVGGEEITFDEALGYREGDRFSARAGADLESFDINVREKDPDRGVNYFEDGGKSIDDRSGDYFDSYFKEPTPSRSGVARLFSTIGAYIGIAFRHIGYFFRNLFRSFKREKKK